jgi:hypothetical protein
MVKSWVIIFGLLWMPMAGWAADFQVATVEGLQNALTTAASNGEADKITIAAGTYAVSTTLTCKITEAFALTITGSGKGSTILDGGNSVQIMFIDSSNLSSDLGLLLKITDVTFQNGNNQDGGGGGLEIRFKDAYVILDHSEFIANNACQACDYPYPTDTEGIGGGGLKILRKPSIDANQMKSGALVLRNCLFQGNSAAYGGGAYVEDGNGLCIEILQNNIFDRNRASFDGGGLWFCFSMLAAKGYIINNTLVKNTADGNGGGAFVELHSMNMVGGCDLFNNIIWNNTAQVQGDDLYFNDQSPSYLNIYNNIFADMAFSNGDTYSENRNLNEDPSLDAAYVPHNPNCINSGDNNAPELSNGDFNGHKRIANATVDRGAIETGSSSPADPEDDPEKYPLPEPTPTPTPSPNPKSGSSGGSGGCFIKTIDKNSEAYKAAQRMAEKFQTIDKNSEVYKEAQRVAEQTQAKIDAQIERLQPEKAQSTPAKPEIVIFVSESMPDALITEFAKSAFRLKEKASVRFVLYGFPQNGLSSFIFGIKAQEYQVDLNIDSFLFKAFDVKTVPTLIADRKFKVNAPLSFRSALQKIQEASNQDFSDLIEELAF